jgi:hypothetical protein
LYAQLKDYLSIPVENGLLGYQEGELWCNSGENGFRFMRKFSDLQDLAMLNERLSSTDMKQ